MTQTERALLMAKREELLRKGPRPSTGIQRNGDHPAGAESGPEFDARMRRNDVENRRSYRAAVAAIDAALSNPNEAGE